MRELWINVLLQHLSPGTKSLGHVNPRSLNLVIFGSRRVSTLAFLTRAGAAAAPWCIGGPGRFPALLSL